MKTEVQIFTNPRFGEIRTAKDENREPLFCLLDVAKALGYSNPSKAVIDHCKGVTVLETPTAGGIQSIKFGKESDVYRLAMRSRLPQAEQFQDWVVEDVIPSIRKTGGYMMATTEDTPEMIMARAILVANDTINRMNSKLREKEKQIELQEATIKHNLPKVQFYDTLMTSDSHHTATSIGAQFNISATELNRLLVYTGIIRRTGREYSLMAKYQGQNMIWPKPVNYEGRDGRIHSIIELRWKERGRELITNTIKESLKNGTLLQKKGRLFFNKALITKNIEQDV